MPETVPGKVLRIHIRESDRYQGRPLYEALVETCRRLGIAGATVLRGVEGYGELAEIHRERALSHPQPVVVVVVDTPENIARLLPAVEAQLASGGLIVSGNAEIRRVEKSIAGC